MEDYDLRCCFLPNLAGLHLRIYQFQQLLNQHLPELAQHLVHLQVEGTYLSQWFLSFFATTCPLPLLFRIYDVIFAEGASETIMRVALSIMRRNEKKLLGFTEFEDAMQLLLGRALWDPYGLSATCADELVSDFVSFTSVVTRESLRALEVSFRDAKEADAGGALSFFPSVQHAASRFLQRRLWTNHTPSKSQPLVVPQSLTPGASATSRPQSMLLRTPSKQSLLTLYSAGDSSEGSISTASTSMTEISSISRESSADLSSLKSIKSPSESDPGVRATTLSTRDKDLHGQIEDLLMALTEMQREHATLAAQLQREREERNEDRLVVRSLVDHLREELVQASSSTKQNRRKTAAAAELSTADIFASATDRTLSDKVSRIVESVDLRLTARTHRRKSSTFETKAQLRQTNASLHERLRDEAAARQDLARQLAEREHEAGGLREDVQRARARIKDGHAERERLQKTVRELRMAQRIKIEPGAVAVSRSRSGSLNSTDDGPAPPRSPSWSIARSDTDESADRAAGGAGPSGAPPTSGLRELRLGRTHTDRLSKRATSTSFALPVAPHGPTLAFAKRTSSLAAASLFPTATPAAPDASPPQQQQQQDDPLLLADLVAAKTAEAVARQELDELRAKFDALRKMMLGVSTSSISSTATTTTTSSSTAASHSSFPTSSSASSTPASDIQSARRPPALRDSSPAASGPASASSTSPLPTPSSHASSASVSTPGGTWTGSAVGFFGWAKRSASAGRPGQVA